MRKITLLFLLNLALFGRTISQNGYDITINVKNNSDTMMYLVRTMFDRQYVSDTCKNIKNGVVRFKGKKNLEKGVYTLVNQDKAIYFDFMINEGSKFSISFDRKDIANTLKASGSKENERMFEYLSFMSLKNKEFNDTRDAYKGKKDSAEKVAAQISKMTDDVKKYEEVFMAKVKGTFVYDFMNMKMEKEAKDVPLASNGRPDSVYRYYYYKNHFFDGVDFKDDRILTIPFFDDRVKRYFDGVIFQYSPDSLIKEIDKVMGMCKEQGMVYNILLGHFTYKYETDKRMGFDKVFVHIADNYITNGKAKDVYSEETVQKIKERTDVLRNLLLESKASELFMIDTLDGKKVSKLGFDTVTTSKSATDLYNKHSNLLLPLFKTLYTVNAKYTVLVFWDVDCGHCQTEVPKLSEELKRIKGKIDYKVLAIYTKDEFEKWRKFVIDKKLDFINLYDPVHINNMKDKYDIIATPVIYVLDKDKKIKGKKLSAEQVPDLLEMLEKQSQEK